MLAPCKNKSPGVSCASFVPLGTNWACSCCEKWCCVPTASKEFRWSTVCCHAGLLVCCLLARINFRSVLDLSFSSLLSSLIYLFALSLLLSLSSLSFFFSVSFFVFFLFISLPLSLFLYFFSLGQFLDAAKRSHFVFVLKM